MDGERVAPLLPIRLIPEPLKAGSLQRGQEDVETCSRVAVQAAFFAAVAVPPVDKALYLNTSMVAVWFMCPMYCSP